MISTDKPDFPDEYRWSVRLRTALYTALTSCIILLGRAREAIAAKHMFIRGDRSLPWGEPRHVLLMTCCDCGLTHFFVAGTSATPERPLCYEYRLRFGAAGWTEPDASLGMEATRLYVETAPENTQEGEQDGAD